MVLLAIDAVGVGGMHPALVAEMERLATHSDARVRAAKQLLRKSAMPDTPVPPR